MAPPSAASRIPIMIGRIRRGCRTTKGTDSTTSGDFGAKLTGLPHFRQNCASSGSVAPHLAHPRRTLATGGGVLFGDILTFSPRLRENFEHQGDLRRKFCRTGRFSKAEMPADISTAL